MAKKKRATMAGPDGSFVGVRRIRFEGTREQVTTIARAIGWFDFSDPSSRVFRAQPPENVHQRGDWVATSRNRTTLPDFDRIGGAWKLHGWFSARNAPTNVTRAFFDLIAAEVGDDSPGALFDTTRDSWEVARIIAECALGVLEPAEKRGWL